MSEANKQLHFNSLPILCDECKGFEPECPLCEGTGLIVLNETTGEFESVNMIHLDHRTYVTFGQDHIHTVNGKIFDRNCVAVINCHNSVNGRALAFEFFGDKFCFEYPESKFDFDSMKYFPRGFIEVN